MGADDRSPTENDRAFPTDLSDDLSSTELPISISDLLLLLANDRTRYLLYFLTERGGTVFLDELEDHFEDEEATTMLHHHHLPRLVDFHIIDYEQDSRAITLTPIGDDLKPALETIQSLEDTAATAFLNRTAR